MYSEIILTMKKALIVILLLVLVGGYFFAGYSVYTQATLVECAVPEVDQNNRPDNFSLSDKDVFWDPSEYFVNDYEVVNIELSDENISLNSWWLDAQNNNGPTVLVLHGLGSGKHSPDMLLTAGMLYKNGFNVLAIDCRDHGESTCEDGFHSAGQKESDDVVASLDWIVNEKGISPDNIGIYGSSLGALVGLLTPSKSNNFSALAVLDAPFDFETLVREELIYQGFSELLWTPLYHYVLIFEGINLLANNPEDSLKAGNKQPILIFNGMDNDRVLPHHTDDLIDSATEIGIELEINRYEELGHTRVLYDYPKEFSIKLVQFFSRHLN